MENGLRKRGTGEISLFCREGKGVQKDGLSLLSWNQERKKKGGMKGTVRGKGASSAEKPGRISEGDSCGKGGL